MSRIVNKIDVKCSEDKNVNFGVLQGSILDPVLFNICVHVLLIFGFMRT